MTKKTAHPQATDTRPRFRVARLLTIDEPPQELPGFVVVDTTRQFGGTHFDTIDQAAAQAARWNNDYPPQPPQAPTTEYRP